MITEGSVGNAVVLNDHLWGPKIKEIHWNPLDPIVVLTVTAGVPITPHWLIDGFSGPIPDGVVEGGDNPDTPLTMSLNFMKTFYDFENGGGAATVIENNVIYATLLEWITAYTVVIDGVDSIVPASYTTQNLLCNTTTYSVLFNMKYVVKAGVQIYGSLASYSQPGPISYAWNSDNTVLTATQEPSTYYTAKPTFVTVEARSFKKGAVFTLEPDGTVSADRAADWSFNDTITAPLSTLGANGPSAFVRFNKDGSVT